MCGSGQAGDCQAVETWPDGVGNLSCSFRECRAVAVDSNDEQIWTMCDPSLHERQIRPKLREDVACTSAS